MSRRLAFVFRALLPALLLIVLTGCGNGSSGGERQRTITVFAAASLTQTFSAIGEEFEREHDRVTVEINFGGSADLVAQLQQGAAADVFASADQTTMDKLTAAGLHAAEPQIFAANTLQIVTPPDNPAGVTSFVDLADDGVQVVVCAPQVPCGAAAVRVQEASGVKLDPVSEEQSVTDVLAKVTSGEADAGLVYRTDVAAAGDAVLGIPLPEASGISNPYPIAALKGSEHAELARAFVDFVLGETGQAILERAGFAKG